MMVTRLRSPRDASSAAMKSELLALLSLEDRTEYEGLLNTISRDMQQKQTGIPSFINHLSLVHKFVRRGNAGDALRGLVCGVEFGPGFFFVHTTRLKKVLSRSKSCLNGCFQRVGYDVIRSSQEIVSLFGHLFPNVNPELFALRQWCVRLAREGTALSFTPSLPESFCETLQTVPWVPHKSDPKSHEKANFLDIRSLLNGDQMRFP
jgi:hypothetical protein